MSGKVTKTPEHRFGEKIWHEPDASCVLWTGRVSTRGYGQFWLDGREVPAHRWAYGLERIPAGLSLDHLCRTRNCVNPDHLEPVTQRENVLRGCGIPAQNTQKTHCKRGHPYSGGNLYVTPSGRERKCRNCERARRKRRREEGRA